MTPNDGVRLAAAEFEENTSRARELAAKRREWVYGSEMTPAELVAERDRRLRECRERNPRWFEEAA